MARIAPFPFKATAAIEPHRFVNVDLAAGTCTPATNLASTLGLTTGSLSAETGDFISVRSVKDATATFLVECGGVIAAGDLVCSDANSKAVTDVAGVMVALEAGVAGQLINVISAGAF